jgi:hypothetical protein
MTDRGILFSAPMVRALLDGRKSQTRRILKPQPETFQTDDGECEVKAYHIAGEALPRVATGRVITLQKLPFAPGDRLWVREAWRTSKVADELRPSQLTGGGYSRIWYELDRDNCDQHGRYRHARFMPRWASRLTLTVTDVRVQRLQDISEADAIREGVTLIEESCECPAQAYRDLWESINGAGSWNDNPWIVAVSFEVRKGNIDGEAA